MSEPNLKDQPDKPRWFHGNTWLVGSIAALAISATVVLVAGAIIGFSQWSTLFGIGEAERGDAAAFPASTTQTSGRVPAVGEAAPDFTLKNLDGQEIPLSVQRGHPVLINFWATWCAPCRVEMPDLVRAFNARQADGLKILAINATYQDALPEVQSFAKEFNIPFPVLLDDTGAVARDRYGLRGMPMSIFIDRQGIIIRRHLGAMTSEQIDKFVDELMR